MSVKKLVSMRDISRPHRDRLMDAIRSFKPELVNDGPKSTLDARIRRMRTYELHSERFSHHRHCAGCGLVEGIGFIGPQGLVVQCDPDPRSVGETRNGKWFCVEECLSYYEKKVVDAH